MARRQRRNHAGEFKARRRSGFGDTRNGSITNSRLSITPALLAKSSAGSQGAANDRCRMCPDRRMAKSASVRQRGLDQS